MIGHNKKEGRPAITECIVEKTLDISEEILHNMRLQKKHSSLSRIKLWTDRRHQIRLPLSNIGYPIIGSKKYSADHKLFDRMYLDSH